MSKIHVLDKQVANLIAAGEVVDRPASIVKELVENSIDAGASSITVEIREGGVSYLRVTDNGCGMNEEDARLSFARHATSKVRQAEDLTAIGTLGFRGEALAATAAVSKVQLRTREPSEVEGTEVMVEGGAEVAVNPCGCPAGTTIIVRELFYNTPARRKFLKKETTEAATVGAMVEKLAMANPAVAFEYIKDGKTSLLTPGGDLRTAARSVLGRSVDAMLAVEGASGEVQVSGLVSPPEAARPNRGGQHFFVSGRYIRSRTLQIAVEEAVAGRVPAGRYPACVIVIDLPPELIDVNVHPQKLEVRFANERAVFDAVSGSVRSAFDGRSAPPELRFASAGQSLAHSAPPPAPRNEPMSAEVPLFAQNPPPAVPVFAQAAPQTRAPRGRLDIDAADWEYVPPKKAEDKEEGAAPPQPAQAEPVKAEAFAPDVLMPEPADKPQTEEQKTLDMPPAFRMVGELYHTYFIVEFEDEVWLVDKHAAKERMLYEELLKAGGAMPQRLMEPKLCVLGRADTAAALEGMEALAACGFEIEAFGDDTLLVRSMPMGIDAAHCEELITELCGLLREGRREPVPELTRRMLHKTACVAAVKGGDRESPMAGEEMVRELIASPELRSCPHGRPCVKRLPKSYFEKEFYRT
ncbi:MAG TPA: DNA mismatch repair endonuclease MutL [Terriglobales bacterium]|nr:DNA mismatch repair endonuclease MutL [Terriglobales bacterium]